MKICILPNAVFFEDHFSALGVSPAMVASGEYRGTWITQYAAVLSRNGHSVTLLSPSRVASTMTPGARMTVKLLRANGLIRHIPKRFIRGPLRNFFSFVSTGALVRELQAFDAIYVQEYGSGRFARVVRDHARIIGAHHGTGVSSAPAWVKRSLTKTKTVFTVLTTEERDNLVQVVGPSADVRLIPNPVDHVFFEQREFPDANRLIWVGRLEDRSKGLFRLLGIVEGVAERLPSVSLSVVGDGPHRSQLEAYVAQSETLRERVTFHGRIDSAQQLADIMSSAKALINTSNVEGFPIAVAEAMAAGRGLFLRKLPYVSGDLAAVEMVHAFDDEQAVEMIVSELPAMITSASNSRKWAEIAFGGHAFESRLLRLFE